MACELKCDQELRHEQGCWTASDTPSLALAHENKRIKQIKDASSSDDKAYNTDRCADYVLVSWMILHARWETNGNASESFGTDSAQEHEMQECHLRCVSLW